MNAGESPMRWIITAALLLAFANTPARAQTQTYEQKTAKLRDLVTAIDAGANEASEVPLSGWIQMAQNELHAIKPKLTPAEKARASLNAYDQALAKYLEFQNDLYKFFREPPPDATRQTNADQITEVEKDAHKAVEHADSLFAAGN
jgi:hypothetical protein